MSTTIVSKMNYSEKNSIITGGTGDIGFAIARELLQNGVINLGIIDIADKNDRILSLKNEFEDRNIVFLQADVSQKNQLQKSFQMFINDYKFVDIVIAAAGIVSETNYEKCINVNLTGIMNTTYVGLEFMGIEAGGRGGVIVNIASIGGLDAIHAVPAYTASKFGIVGFTAALSHTYYSNKYGIKFMTICPGRTDTALLKGSANFIFGPKHLDDYKDLYAKSLQSAEEASKCLIEIIELDKNGSIWIINNGKYYETSLTEYLINCK